MVLIVDDLIGNREDGLCAIVYRLAMKEVVATYTIQYITQLNMTYSLPLYRRLLLLLVVG